MDNILVVSVIGPQSSGKSLLLNFLFGTQFLSSAGRCTKGVYASLIDLKNGNKDIKYKKILLLDTEGLQATEGRDERFDKRIVFYILCVSHVILICNKGEMNSQMSEILKIASDAITTLRQEIIQGQNVNIVMNMLAQINENALQESTQKLSEALIEIDKEQKMKKIFHITDNVFLLPYAFDRSGQGNFVVNKPSQEFSQKIEPLRKRILQQATIQKNESITYHTIESWFKFADRFWTFTQNFKGIIDYDTLDQKRQDQKLTEKCRLLMEINFESQITENLQVIDLILDETLLPHQGVAFTQIDSIQGEAKNRIFEIHQNIQKKIEEEYRTFCGDENINVTLRDKRKNRLVRGIQFYLTEWYNYANKKVAEFADKKSKIVGDSRLQNYLSKAMALKETYQEEEAEQIFEIAWNEKENDIENMLQKQDVTRSEIFTLVHNFYRSEMLDKHIENISQEKQLLIDFEKEGQQAINQHIRIHQQKKGFLYFIGNEV